MTIRHSSIRVVASSERVRKPFQNLFLFFFLFFFHEIPSLTHVRFAIESSWQVCEILLHPARSFPSGGKRFSRTTTHFVRPVSTLLVSFCNCLVANWTLRGLKLRFSRETDRLEMVSLDALIWRNPPRKMDLYVFNGRKRDWFLSRKFSRKCFFEHSRDDSNPKISLLDNYWNRKINNQ